MSASRTRSVVSPIFIHAPPAKVFRWVTESELLTRWFADTATLSAQRGGAYSLGWNPGPTHSGTVLAFVKDKHVTLSWQWPGHEGLPRTKLCLSVERKGRGTVLRFTHTGFRRGGEWDDLYEGAIRGWTYFTMNLKSVPENGHDLRSPHDW